jgi:hypothetical protein
MSVSIFIPKAFSMRSAMSPERAALPFSRLDRAGRETRSAIAAAVTVRPAGCHFGPDEISGMARVLHRHGIFT